MKFECLGTVIYRDGNEHICVVIVEAEDREEAKHFLRHGCFDNPENSELSLDFRTVTRIE